MKLKILDDSRPKTSLPIYEHFRQFYQLSTQAKVTPDAFFTQHSGITEAYSGIPFAFCNALILDEPVNDDFEEKVSQSIKKLSDKNQPFACYLSPENAFLSEYLISQGFEPVGIFKGYSSDLNYLNKPSLHKSAKIKPVKTDEDAKLFVDILSECFDFDHAIEKGYLQFIKHSLTLNHVYHYLAYIDDKPVATLSAFHDKQAVSLWNGATKVEYRKSGICSFLAHHCLKQAKEDGIDIGMTYLMNDAAKTISESLGGRISLEIVTLIKNPTMKI